MGSGIWQSREKPEVILLLRAEVPATQSGNVICLCPILFTRLYKQVGSQQSQLGIEQHLLILKPEVIGEVLKIANELFFIFSSGIYYFPYILETISGVNLKGTTSGRWLEAIIKLPDTSEIIAHIYCGLATNLFVRHFSSHLNFGNKDKNPRGNHKNSLSSQTDVTGFIIEF